MPTVILFDVSLSMTRPIEIADNLETTPKQLAILGINAFLDHVSANTKLEFISLMAFSSLYEEKSPFTRDYNAIKSTLQNIDVYDKTCLETALHGVNQMVLSEWGNNTACQIVLVTDGSAGIGPMSLKESLSTLSQRTSNNPFCIPFSFPAKLHVVCLSTQNDLCLQRSKPLYQKLIDLSGYEGSISVPDQLNEASVITLFRKLAEDVYISFNGTLKCGNLKSRIVLYPAPVHYTKVTDFDCQTYAVSETMAVSRHLLLHAGNSIKDPAAMETDVDLTTEDDLGDEGKTPSFCVLLHGALKVENMAALVSLGNNWFGFIYSWADTWLGDLNYLGCSEHFEQTTSFPIRPSEKRSYSQNGVVWIRPEKTQQFYKELNRLRKAAISLGFLELLLALAAIFEQECLTLPGNVHPDCAVQLQHAADVLKKTHNQDAKFVITPYIANYNNL